MRIGDICVYAPKSQIKAGEAVEGAKYMFFTSGADENKRYCDYQLEGEGIIMGTGGNATLHYYSGKYAVSTDCVVLMPDEIVRCKYLYYFFKANINVLEAGFKGAGLRHTNKKYIDDIIIKNIPGYDEQDKIIRTLDKLQDIVDKRNHELCLLDSLIKARFVEMFGNVGTGAYNYKTYKLGDVAKVGSSHRVFTTEFVESGIPFYRGTEISELADGREPSNSYYISEKHYERLTSDDTKPLVGDLLMPSICNKGQVWMVDTEQRFYYKDGRVLCISPDRTLFNSKFLQYFMREKTLVEYPKMGSGSTFAEFKIFLLKDMDVLVPPREIQDKFADFVKQVDKSKLAVQESLEKTQQLFDSLMQEYFG